jgi:hypothetical protein
MSKPTPTWLVERLAQGELDAATAADVRARLAAEGRSPDEVLAALADANRAFLANMPKQQAAAAIRARLARTTAPKRRPLIWLVPVAGLAMAAVLMAGRVRPGGPTPTGGDELEETGIKGGAPKAARLVVYRHRDAHNERLPGGAHAERGDRLQLAYVTRDDGYGLIVSLDGAGRVTLHLPEENASTAAALQAAGEVQLPESYELDDAPVFERFFFVTARSPFAIAPVVQAVRALATSPTAETGALPLPAGFTQTSLKLDKRPKEKP